MLDHVVDRDPVCDCGCEHYNPWEANDPGDLTDNQKPCYQIPTILPNELDHVALSYSYVIAYSIGECNCLYEAAFRDHY